MKNVKTVEFVNFVWILIGLFNFSSVHSSESESHDDPVSVVLNKCNPDSLDSTADVEQFNNAFGYVVDEGKKFHALNFTFNSSFYGLNSRCEIRTVNFQLDSASRSAPVPIKLSVVTLSEFFEHGFFSYEANYFINPKNYCVKKLSQDILTVEICKAASTSSPNQDSTGFHSPPTLQKCCRVGNLITIDKNQTVTCDFSYEPPWKPGNFRGGMEIYPNYNVKIPCNSFYHILPHQLAPKIKREQNPPIKFKDVRVLENGQVETRDSGNHKWKKLEKNTYCIDGFYAKLTGNKSAEEETADNFMLVQCQTTTTTETTTIPPEPTKDNTPSSLTIGLLVAAAVLLLAFIVLIHKHFQTRKELRLLTANEIDEFVKGDPGKLKDVEIQGENVHLLPFNKKYEVSDSDYSIDHAKILGSGEFGTVYGGTLRQIPVAIKTTKSETDVEFFKAFLKEIKVMTFIGEHENVVQLLGTVTNRIRERVVFIIVELATHGSLYSFLIEHQNNFVNSLSSSQLLQISQEQINPIEYANTPANGQLPVTTLDLVKWCGQIASGMSHLASKKIIHGDLAARNILLFADYTAKITDFGLARQLYTSPNYVKKQQSPLPWRIMAPESLKNLQFSVKSDVWSFGVLAWEIFSLAAVPYAGLSWTHDFVDQLEQDLRLQKPKWAANDVYENMCSCWHPVANSRPDFEHLEQFYKGILQHPANESETVHLELVQTTRV